MTSDAKTNPKAARVVVVGGGVAGLTAAFALREDARRRGIPIALTVFEASDRIGGHVKTDRVEGFVFEQGPNGFLDDAPETLALVDQLGLTTLTADAASARRYVYLDGRAQAIPTRPGAFLRSPILPVSAKLRMAAEIFVPPKRGDDDESVAAFARRRLGDAFARRLIDPMVSGIYAGDPEALSLPAAFPKMAALERTYGGLFRALARRRRERRTSGGGPAGPAGTLRSFPHGMGELTDALAAALEGQIVTGAPVRRLERTGAACRVVLDGRAVDCDHLILALPAHGAAPLIAPLDASAAEALAAIPFASVAVACEGYGPRALRRPIDGFGVLAPRGEGLRALGVLCGHRIFPAHAPAGRALIRTLVGGARDPEAATLDDDALAEVVHRDLDALVGLAGEADPARCYRHAAAIPQYTLGHRDRVATIDRFAAEAGIHFTGASYRGVAVNACIADAYRTAARIAAALTEITPPRPERASPTICGAC